MAPKVSELGPAKEIVIANVCAAIGLSTMSLIHTMMVLGNEGAVEANPVTGFVLEISPALAFPAAPLAIISITYAAWKFHVYAGVSVSSVFRRGRGVRLMDPPVPRDAVTEEDGTWSTPTAANYTKQS